MKQVDHWLTVLERESERSVADEPNVLILGESGTGKEGIARQVHLGSRGAKGPWVAVNCANFGENLLESELFGHEKGAFTGATTMKRGLIEIAQGGTLFLDELGETDIKLQAKLLRVIQEKLYRRVGGVSDLQAQVRIVAATNQNLEAKVKEGNFREDLYHRLSRVVIDLPPLRDRADDVLPMATLFAMQAFGSRGKKFKGFALDASQALFAYPWPGNVRELLNVIERCALLSDQDGPIPAANLGLPIPAESPGVTGSSKIHVLKPQFAAKIDLNWGNYTVLKRRWCDAFEREYLSAVLTRHDGNVSSAAREAKLDRSNFLRLLRRHGLKSEHFRNGESEKNQDQNTGETGLKIVA